MELQQISPPDSSIVHSNVDNVDTTSDDVLGYDDKQYIADLEAALREHNIDLPVRRLHQPSPVVPLVDEMGVQDISRKNLSEIMKTMKELRRPLSVSIAYKNLTYWTLVPEALSSIPSIWQSVLHMLGQGEKLQRLDILDNISGRIKAGTMTLVIGPPGSGKTTFLKALAGHLTTSRQLEGSIAYNGGFESSGEFLVRKITEYTEKLENLYPTLTVQETLEFAWRATTGGHHSYMIAKDADSARQLNALDPHLYKIQRCMEILGIDNVRDSYVGGKLMRGVSGGERRRVTLGESLMAPRPVKLMDSVTNGLDATSAFDIMNAVRMACDAFGVTVVASLAQPSPEIFELFDEVVLLTEGRVVYHGQVSSVLDYFKDAGLRCPPTVDTSDFLMSVLTGDTDSYREEELWPEGVCSHTLAGVWQKSEAFTNLMSETDSSYVHSSFDWPDECREMFAVGYFSSFTLLLGHLGKLAARDRRFIRTRLFQQVVVGGIAASLFHSLDVTDAQTMSGFMFFASLKCALGGMAMIPMIFQQRAIFYKQSASLYYPTSCFTISQTLVHIPLMALEVLLFCGITYFAVGLSDSDSWSRFFVFNLIIFALSVVMSQYFRVLGCLFSSESVAQPVGGVSLVVMILFSGYVIPKASIPDYWTWLYWLNPVAWNLKALAVNEFRASDYDFNVCVTPTCSQTERFGDVVLERNGNPTAQHWVWISFLVLIGEYVFLLLVTQVLLMVVRREDSPIPPRRHQHTVTNRSTEDENNLYSNSFPPDPLVFAFKNVGFTVKLPNHERLDLLRGISGYFRPGTMTALMGTSGAGKVVVHQYLDLCSNCTRQTTLLDVLSGRKNTGKVTGSIFVNGKPKNQQKFRRVMGYVEQFDTLAPHDTAREAVEFSAAMRLKGMETVGREVMRDWVEGILNMLELQEVSDNMIGTLGSKGMSVEQRKRVSIAVELAANPAILFLDEPTSGLDSRSATSVMRCIRRLTDSGRTIVCTIHQPSLCIFNQFDSLLLLQRGGTTAYFGSLGENSSKLKAYFEGIVPSRPLKANYNPATWMLDVLNAEVSTIDFHSRYCDSCLCNYNTTVLESMCCASEVVDTSYERHCGNDDAIKEEIKATENNRNDWFAISKRQYNTSRLTQVRYLMCRWWAVYWRSPNYNLSRMWISATLALVFASAYADQVYWKEVDVIARTSVFFITILFSGLVSMVSVIPVSFAEREAFYREQSSGMYSPVLYTITASIVEIPYIMVAALTFTLPFFYIVGFDKYGATEKFFWLWAFQSLYTGVLVHMGQFFAAFFPTKTLATVASGITATLLSLFAGFMIKPDDFPDFWLFMYYLNPTHYALEGINFTQFHNDRTEVTLTTGQKTTAEEYIADFYPDWSYDNRYYDVLALFIFITVLRVGTYVSYSNLKHQRR